ncbi:dimethylarginine dimethylaminohydrolase family protein [Paraliobacillus sp. JSM ZJ581]|uniref:dimethylarginine dimethylaminohydrolase family protein n=1 Tax=Paraliobacillus sp. JSM ZJ581 TaxID=3342118 RepID=UPI0035A82A1A
MQSNQKVVIDEVNCETEYGRLEKVIVCSPAYMKIGKIINETQKHYKSENIDVQIAMEQHEQFVQTLKDQQIEVLELKPNPDLYEQVFTRDIGFCIGKTLYTSNMQRQIRAPEVSELKRHLAQQLIPFQSIETSSIEGGDVIVDGQTIWIGVSERTTIDAIQMLQTQLPHHQIIPLPIPKQILHLDCAFNVIAHHTVLIYPDAFQEDDLKKIENNYEVIIKVSEEEQFTLGTNVLPIGNYTVISLPENKKVNQDLTRHGFSVIEVPFSEIIKSGGSFRCCSLPIRRVD